MMESPVYSEAQLGQVRMGMAGVRRPRGRPRIENPSNRKGAIRGARQGTIDLFKKACEEHGKDPGQELEEVLREAIRKLAGDEAVKQILDEMKAEKMGLEQRIAIWQARYDELQKTKNSGPPGGVPYEEALEREADRQSTGERVFNYMGVLDDVARRLARDYPGHHWQTIKRELKGRIEERLPNNKQAVGE